MSPARATVVAHRQGGGLGMSTRVPRLEQRQASHPKIRNLPFQFGDDTPFQWNPANPLFGFAMNSLSFIAPPFERYIVAGLRQAMPRIDDPAVTAEADAFLRQEAQHARVHRLHVAALTKRYPGLAEISAELDRRFDRLIETQSLEFHLAY